MGRARDARHLYGGIRHARDGSAEQVMPVPFADIMSQTMVSISHLLSSSLWLGIATDAMSRARDYAQDVARRQQRSRRSRAAAG